MKERLSDATTMSVRERTRERAIALRGKLREWVRGTASETDSE